MKSMFSDQFLKEMVEIAHKIDHDPIERMACILAEVRTRGRLFILGVGGSAANASHAVNDFRKLCGIEAYAPTDNVAEITARTNDDGWFTVFEEWLKNSNLNKDDAILILSVGGGSEKISSNLVNAIRYAKSRYAVVLGIVGRDGGATATAAEQCVIIPTVNPDHITPHSESWQAIVWHLLVSHPLLKRSQTKWESINKAVFLDRDGTLTTDPSGDKDIQLQSDAITSVKRLKDAGFKVVMVTNQPDIARGKKSLASVNAINGALKDDLSLDAAYVCPHDDGDCSCRKPKPGMLKQAASEHGIDLKYSYMVGDTWRDIGAGRAAGCKTVWLRNPATAPGLHAIGKVGAYATSLSDAVDWILGGF